MVWAVDVTFSRSVSLSYVRTRHTVYMPPLLPFCIVCVPQLLPLVALLFCIICVPLRKILGKESGCTYIRTWCIHAGCVQCDLPEVTCGAKCVHYIEGSVANSVYLVPSMWNGIQGSGLVTFNSTGGFPGLCLAHCMIYIWLQLEQRLHTYVTPVP